MQKDTERLQESYVALWEKYSNLQKMYDILEKIIENSADAFWVFDGEGKCIRVNAAYEELIGLPREVDRDPLKRPCWKCGIRNHCRAFIGNTASGHN